MSNWKTYSFALLSEAPAKPGVYVIYQADIPVYIGHSENLRKRLKRHWCVPPSMRSVSHFKLKACPKRGEWLMVHHRLVGRLLPMFNNSRAVQASRENKIVDEDTSVIIGNLTELGKTPNSIAKKLNTGGYRDLLGRSWTPNSVKSAQSRGRL